MGGQVGALVVAGCMPGGRVERILSNFSQFANFAYTGGNRLSSTVHRRICTRIVHLRRQVFPSVCSRHSIRHLNLFKSVCLILEKSNANLALKITNSAEIWPTSIIISHSTVKFLP